MLVLLLVVMMTVPHLGREFSSDDENSPSLALQLREEGPQVQVAKSLRTGEQTIEIPVSIGWGRKCFVCVWIGWCV